MPKYTVRRPISSDRNLAREGAVVSRHTTLSGACKRLAAERRGAAKQGGHSQDYIWDEVWDEEVFTEGEGE